LSIGVAIPGGRNVVKKEVKKISKCKDFVIEIQCMWNVKAKVIPVIIGATETISKPLRQYLTNIRRQHKIKELQKTAILGTAHITYCGKFYLEVQNIFHKRNNITCSTNRKYRTAATP
jgi:hypothetical protein